MDMFHMLPASTFKLFESLLGLTIKGEKALGTEVSHLSLSLCLSLSLSFYFSLSLPPPSPLHTIFSLPLSTSQYPLVINIVHALSQLGSPFREPVLKFAIKFPAQTVDYFLCRLVETTLSRIFHWLLKHKDGGPLREALLNAPQKIISTTFTLAVS